MKATTEREAVLIVASRRPDRTLRRLVSLRRLDPFELRPRGVEVIRDTYLDTPDQQLGKRRIALRTRETAGKTMVTLKTPGPARLGVPGRSELELPLNLANAKRVLAALHRLGIRGRALPAPREMVAQDWTAGSSLVPVQVRATRRVARDVFRRSSLRPRRVAEMAVDRVRFDLRDGQVSFDEVEVEAKERGTARDVREIVAALAHRFQEELRPWPYSKFATGKVLEEWHHAGRLGSVVTRKHRLDPSALPALARQLGRP